jgi:CTP:molybdopterin cytidylyltransferase MocA
VLERVRQSRVSPIVVVAGAYELDAEGVTLVSCPDWDRGPGASLRCGLAALPDETEAVAVCLADGPNISPRAIERVVESWRRRGEVRRRARASGRDRAGRLGVDSGRGCACPSRDARRLR